MSELPADSGSHDDDANEDADQEGMLSSKMMSSSGEAAESSLISTEAASASSSSATRTASATAKKTRRSYHKKVDPKERLERRKESNRLSKRRCRGMKRSLRATIQDEFQLLSQEYKKLLEENEALKKELFDQVQKGFGDNADSSSPSAAAADERCAPRQPLALQNEVTMLSATQDMERSSDLSSFRLVSKLLSAESFDEELKQSAQALAHQHRSTLINESGWSEHASLSAVRNNAASQTPNSNGFDLQTLSAVYSLLTANANTSATSNASNENNKVLRETGQAVDPLLYLRGIIHNSAYQSLQANNNLMVAPPRSNSEQTYRDMWRQLQIENMNHHYYRRHEQQHSHLPSSTAASSIALPSTPDSSTAMLAFLANQIQNSNISAHLPLNFGQQQQQKSYEEHEQEPYSDIRRIYALQTMEHGLNVAQNNNINNDMDIRNSLCNQPRSQVASTSNSLYLRNVTSTARGTTDQGAHQQQEPQPRAVNNDSSKIDSALC